MTSLRKIELTSVSQSEMTAFEIANCDFALGQKLSPDQYSANTQLAEITSKLILRDLDRQFSNS